MKMITDSSQICRVHGGEVDASIMILLKLPHDVIESIVFVALLGDPVLSSEAGVRRVLCSIRASCLFLQKSSNMRSVARKCLSSPHVLEDLLLARRRVALHRFLRLAGGYALAVDIFNAEIRLMRYSKNSNVPLPIVATLCKLSGRLFAQISAYTQVHSLLMTVSLSRVVVLHLGSPERTHARTRSHTHTQPKKNLNSRVWTISIFTHTHTERQFVCV
jgi:hypothetical protein